MYHITEAIHFTLKLVQENNALKSICMVRTFGVLWLKLMLEIAKYLPIRLWKFTGCLGYRRASIYILRIIIKNCNLLLRITLLFFKFSFMIYSFSGVRTIWDNIFSTPFEISQKHALKRSHWLPNQNCLGNVLLNQCFECSNIFDCFTRLSW